MRRACLRETAFGAAVDELLDVGVVGAVGLLDNAHGKLKIWIGHCLFHYDVRHCDALSLF